MTKIDPILSFLIAVLSGVCSLYFGMKITPIFSEITEIIDSGAKIGGAGALTIGLAVLWGLFAYTLSIVFQVANRRVVDAIYNNEKGGRNEIRLQTRN